MKLKDENGRIVDVEQITLEDDVLYGWDKTGLAGGGYPVILAAGEEAFLMLEKLKDKLPFGVYDEGRFVEGSEWEILGAGSICMFDFSLYFFLEHKELLTAILHKYKRDINEQTWKIYHWGKNSKQV